MKLAVFCFFYLGLTGLSFAETLNVPPSNFEGIFVGTASTGCEFYKVAGEVGKRVFVRADESGVTLQRTFENGNTSTEFDRVESKNNDPMMTLIGHAAFMTPEVLNKTTKTYVFQSRLIRVKPEQKTQVLFTVVYKMTAVNGRFTHLKIKIASGEGDSSSHNSVSCDLDRVE